MAKKTKVPDRLTRGKDRKKRLVFNVNAEELKAIVAAADLERLPVAIWIRQKAIAAAGGI
jgi:hypothetical protein